MRLAELLGRRTEHELRALAKDRITDAESMSAGKLAAELETMIRSLAYVQQSLIATLPPTFSILLCLTESQDGCLNGADLKNRVREHSAKLTEDVTSGALLGDEDDRLYRRVLAEAWRTDLALHPDELGLLGVLRHELGLYLVDHYIMAYHPDFFDFWKADDAYPHALTGLNQAGLVFDVDGSWVLADELLPQVSRAIGVYLPRQTLRRLLGWVPNSALADALRAANMAVSGSKLERMERLILRLIPPAEILRFVSLAQLQDIALQLDCPKSGSRDALVDRLMEHFRSGLDHPAPEEVPAELPPEIKSLGEVPFKALFESLTARELVHVLERFPELALSGTKAVRVATLWNSRHAESTLLTELTNRQLAEVLERNDLPLGGSKGERIRRIVGFFGGDAGPTAEES
jgi:hypothetical protein